MYSRDIEVIAEVFNAFFSTVGARAAETSASLAVLHDLPSTALPVFIDQHTPDFEKFHFQVVSEGEIQRIVMSFQSNVAPGYDKVPMSFIIKDALPCILPALTNIVDHSLFIFGISGFLENIRGYSTPKGWRPRVSK